MQASLDLPADGGGVPSGRLQLPCTMLHTQLSHGGHMVDLGPLLGMQRLVLDVGSPTPSSHQEGPFPPTSAATTAGGSSGGGGLVVTMTIDKLSCWGSQPRLYALAAMAGDLRRQPRRPVARPSTAASRRLGGSTLGFPAGTAARAGAAKGSRRGGALRGFTFRVRQVALQVSGVVQGHEMLLMEAVALECAAWGRMLECGQVLSFTVPPFLLPGCCDELRA